jgi:16S rRNA G966 N2-methylase RsmD
MSKSSPVKVAEAKASSAEKQKSIDNHKKAATHFEAATKHHLDASKHHEADDHHKAASSLIAANAIIALEISKEQNLDIQEPYILLRNKFYGKNQLMLIRYEQK